MSPRASIDDTEKRRFLPLTTKQSNIKLTNAAHKGILNVRTLTEYLFLCAYFHNMHCISTETTTTKYNVTINSISTTLNDINTSAL
jgi:hypothetical protein